MNKKAYAGPPLPRNDAYSAFEERMKARFAPLEVEPSADEQQRAFEQAVAAKRQGTGDI